MLTVKEIKGKAGRKQKDYKRFWSEKNRPVRLSSQERTEGNQ